MKYILTWCCLAAGYYVYTQVPAPALVHFLLAYIIGAINVLLVVLALNRP